MADPVSASLAALTQPATLLVEKVSNAIGRHFDPSQAIRMAEAEAKADRIRTVSQVETEIEVAELRQRAAERFIQEQMRMQSNMEMITARAIPHLSDDAEPDKIDDDWVANFFDKSRLVSDDRMQELWAKVLAGEGNHPGRFSRKTVNLIADLGAKEAELFQALCRFTWVINRTIEALIFDEQLDIYNQVGIKYDSIRQLEALGLVHFEGLADVNIKGLPQSTSASYGARQVVLSFPNSSENTLKIGRVIFTQFGRELFPITGATVVDGFFEYVYDRWAEESLVPPRDTEPERTFSDLAELWIQETAIHSNPAIIERHPAYAQLVAMKYDAIPLILKEISQKRNRPHWFQALHDITGMTPAPENTWGNVERVAAAWLEWGREQGHIC